MVFSSTIFLFWFFPLTLLGYFLLKKEYRNVYLLVVSLIYYAWGEPKFVLIMLASTILNYSLGLLIEYVKDKQTLFVQRLVLILTVVSNISLLGYYKYYDFAIATLNNISGLNLPLKHILLPIGISFFTFHGMSYSLDIYFDKAKANRNLISISLYISLFPQLVAGPIIRYHFIKDQLVERFCSTEKFYIGIRRFVFGLTKKVFIANQLGLVADNIFAVPANQNSILIAWLGIISYTFQIYFDFSGYSDMAIGLAKMFGFDFPENFNYPYISKSITEFWRRWHISLSTWFRDYVYIPMGGNRKGNVYLHLWTIFFLTGLWHGAAWNFIFWGLWHGLFLVTERVFRNKNININVPNSIRWIYAMLIVVIGWVMFRSPTLTYAIQYLGVMFGVVKPTGVGYTVFWYLTPKIMFVLIVAALASFSWKEKFSLIYQKFENTYISLFFGNVAIIFLFLLSIILVMTSTYNPFIYFRF